MQRTSPRPLRLVLALSAGLALTVSAGAQPAGKPADAKAQQEREACMSGRSGQDREACLREVGAARDAARRGQLETGHEQLERNRTDRCKALTGADHTDCLARMRGEGSAQGSVKGGGILREKVTIIPAPANAASAANRGTGAAAQGAGAAPSSAGASGPGTSGLRPGSTSGGNPAASAGTK